MLDFLLKQVSMSWTASRLKTNAKEITAKKVTCGRSIKDSSPGAVDWVGVTWVLFVSLCNILSTCPGKGRGRQVIAVARTADVVIMMLDATKGEVQRSAGLGRRQADISSKAWVWRWDTLAPADVSWSFWVVQGVLGPVTWK